MRCAAARAAGRALSVKTLSVTFSNADTKGSLSEANGGMHVCDENVNMSENQKTGAGIELQPSYTGLKAVAAAHARLAQLATAGILAKQFVHLYYTSLYTQRVHVISCAHYHIRTGNSLCLCCIDDCEQCTFCKHNSTISTYLPQIN